MTPEEFERLKEAEKAHLRKMKEIKQAVRGLERQRSISKTLSDMATGAQSSLEAGDEMIERLSMGAVHNEARLDLAMDSAEEQEAARRKTEAFEAEDQKARAARLVEEMKRQVTGGTDSQELQGRPATREPEKTPDPFGPSEPKPEKTIGRMRP